MSRKDKEYDAIDLKDAVWLRPGTYIGSENREERESLLYDYVSDVLVRTKITYPPAAIRLIVEVISNAVDNVRRSVMEHHMDPGTIHVSFDGQWIKVRNEGKPIRLDVMTTTNGHTGYTPQIIFGLFLSGSNFAKGKKRVGSGLNGLGAKLTNRFSQNFQIILGNAEVKYMYKQS